MNTECVNPSPHRALIALNCHPFHDVAALSICIQSVLEAIKVAVQDLEEVSFEPHVFWHRPDAVPDAIAAFLINADMPIHMRSHNSNGENLNSQMDFAQNIDCNIFFRVDADDTVAPDRFVKQAAVLITDRVDLCGAGLKYCPEGEETFPVTPRVIPGPVDYIENCFLLHPTLAIRLDAVRAVGLRYGAERLEDKALMLDAIRAGLRIRNLQFIAGTYQIRPDTRTQMAQKWRSARLNMHLIHQTRQWTLLPYAAAIFAMQVLLGPRILRRLRHAMAGLRGLRITVTPGEPEKCDLNQS